MKAEDFDRKRRMEMEEGRPYEGASKREVKEREGSSKRVINVKLKKRKILQRCE